MENTLSKNFSVIQTNAIKDHKRLKYDLKSVAQTFSKFYFNLAETLLKNLLNSPNKSDRKPEQNSPIL